MVRFKKRSLKFEKPSGAKKRYYSFLTIAPYSDNRILPSDRGRRNSAPTGAALSFSGKIGLYLSLLSQKMHILFLVYIVTKYAPLRRQRWKAG